MPELSTTDRAVSPPKISIPRDYNAAYRPDPAQSAGRTRGQDRIHR